MKGSLRCQQSQIKDVVSEQHAVSHNERAVEGGWTGFEFGNHPHRKRMLHAHLLLASFDATVLSPPPQCEGGAYKCGEGDACEERCQGSHHYLLLLFFSAALDRGKGRDGAHAHHVGIQRVRNILHDRLGYRKCSTIEALAVRKDIHGYTHTHTHTHTHRGIGQRFVEGMDVPMLE